MRIIHDIEGPVQVSGSGHHYSFRVDGDTPPPYDGCRAEILITSADPFGRESEAVYLEGGAKYLREAFTQALRSLDAIEEVCREQYALDLAENWQARHDRYVVEHPKP